MVEKYCGIYCILCQSNQKRYIGQAVDIKDRWINHRVMLTNGKHHSIYLQRSWDLYGEDDFEFTILELCDATLLNEREDYWSIFYDTLAPNGFNMVRGGGFNRELSDATREKMSKAQKGKTVSEEARQKLSKAHKGKAKSEEWKQKISEGHTGIKLPKSEKTKESTSRSRQGKKKNKNSVSKYNGIWFDKKHNKNPWVVEISVRSKKYNIGSYPTEIMAAQAYNLAALYFYGEDARLNSFEEELPDDVKNLTIDFEKIVNGERYSSKYYGVYHKEGSKSYTCSIRDPHEVYIYLGSYPSEILAALVYNQAAIYFYGENARINIICDIPAELKEFKFDIEEWLSKDRSKTSNYLGVSWDKGKEKWVGNIKYGNNQIYLGSFEYEIEAALAVNEALLEYYGYQAQSKLNQISQSDLDSLWSDCYDPTNSLP